MNGRWAIAGCVMMAACAAGCGYSTHSTLDAQYQTIAVPAFKNLSREYDLQAPLTNAVIRKFMADSRLEVTPLDKADLNGPKIKDQKEWYTLRKGHPGLRPERADVRQRRRSNSVSLFCDGRRPPDRCQDRQSTVGR